MSQILSALRTLELERNEQVNAAQSRGRLLAITEAASELVAAEESSAMQTLEPEQQMRLSDSTAEGAPSSERPVELFAVDKKPATEGAVDQESATEIPDEFVTITVNAKDFMNLEERVLRAVQAVQRERHERLLAEERVRGLEKKMSEQTPQIEALEQQLQVFNRRREYGRHRIERLMYLLDSVQA